MTDILAGLIAGFIFGLGLCLSGLADPSVVQGFAQRIERVSARRSPAPVMAAGAMSRRGRRGKVGYKSEQ
jgi:uncharacterized membrane protein YedE/YeeE